MANELILIIEDNEVNRVLVRDMLRFKGYQTLEAQSAEEGHPRCAGKEASADPDGLPSAEDERDRSLAGAARGRMAKRRG